MKGDRRGTLGFAVLDNFSCGISVILISKWGIAVFSEPAGCGFLAFWTVLKIILLVLRRFPSLFQLPTGLSQGNLAFMVTVNFNSLRKRVCYFLWIISQPRQWMLLILSLDLTIINKFLIVISVLLALSSNIQSSGFGMTSRFHFVLKNCGIAVFADYFCGIAVFRTPQCPPPIGDRLEC